MDTRNGDEWTPRMMVHCMSSPRPIERVCHTNIFNQLSIRPCNKLIPVWPSYMICLIVLDVGRHVTWCLVNPITLHVLLHALQLLQATLTCPTSYYSAGEGGDGTGKGVRAKMSDLYTGTSRRRIWKSLLPNYHNMPRHNVV